MPISLQSSVTSFLFENRQCPRLATSAAAARLGRSVARSVGRRGKEVAMICPPEREWGNLPSHGTWLGTLLMTLRHRKREREEGTETGLRVLLKPGAKSVTYYSLK